MVCAGHMRLTAEWRLHLASSSSGQAGLPSSAPAAANLAWQLPVSRPHRGHHTPGNHHLPSNKSSHTDKNKTKYWQLMSGTSSRSLLISDMLTKATLMLLTFKQALQKPEEIQGQFGMLGNFKELHTNSLEFRQTQGTSENFTEQGEPGRTFRQIKKKKRRNLNLSGDRQKERQTGRHYNL